MKIHLSEGSRNATNIRCFLLLQGQMEQSNRLLTVAELKQDGSIIGMVLIWCVADEVQVMEVAVSKKYQGQGVGSAMFAEALSTSTR